MRQDEFTIGRPSKWPPFGRACLIFSTTPATVLEASKGDLIDAGK
jgi:hypothetical protein